MDLFLAILKLLIVNRLDNDLLLHSRVIFDLIFFLPLFNLLLALLLQYLFVQLLLIQILLFQISKHLLLILDHTHLLILKIHPCLNFVLLHVF